MRKPSPGKSSFSYIGAGYGLTARKISGFLAYDFMDLTFQAVIFGKAGIGKNGLEMTLFREEFLHGAVHDNGPRGGDSHPRRFHRAR